MDSTSKERILAAINHRQADRVPMSESFWASTMARWHSEGLPENADLKAYFGLDPRCMTKLDWTLQFQPEVIEETEEYVISLTNNGVKQKSFKGHGSTPLWWDFPITDRASWEEHKSRFAWNESRIDIQAAKAAWESTRHEFQMYMPPCLGFEKFKYVMGMEGVLMAMAADPEWAAEMFMSTAVLAIEGLEVLLRAGLEFDVACVAEDMGYKGKAFFSPAAYRQMIMPCQKLFCKFCHARGMKVMLHSCGNNMELVPLFIEAGFDVLNPLEVKAGMDIFHLKKDYGDVLTLWGGIDVRAISNPDPAVLEKEIREKVTIAKQGGGYIFGSDHSIPDDVSLERYKWMLELGRKYGSYSD